MYQKALKMQSRREAARTLADLVPSVMSLEKKLKDPNSAESKALAAMIVIIVTTHAIEAEVANIMAELRYLREAAAKSDKHHLSAQQHYAQPRSTENKSAEPQLTLTELENRLGVVNRKIERLSNAKTRLEKQQSEVFNQTKEIHSREISEAFRFAGISITPVTLEAFNEINTQKAKILDVDIILRSQREAHQAEVVQAQTVGAPPPPPPFAPPRAEFKQRAEQARELSWSAALGGVIFAALETSPEFKQPLLELIYGRENLREVPFNSITNVAASLKALGYLRPLFERQVNDLERLHEYFGGENQRIQALLFGAMTEKMGLEREIYQRSSYSGAPVFLATTPSMSLLFQTNSTGERKQEADQEKNAEDKGSFIRPG